MNLLITGSRYGHPLVEPVMQSYLDVFGKPELLVLGDARGVDYQALVFAQQHGLPHVVLEADWYNLLTRAGPERNSRMVEAAGSGARALAFPGYASRGTWDCIRQCRAAGMLVWVAEEGA